MKKYTIIFVLFLVIGLWAEESFPKASRIGMPDPVASPLAESGGLLKDYLGASPKSLNYLLDNKAVIWNASGRYSIDYAKTWEALETLGAEILRIQAHGDLEAARACIEKYGVAGLESQSDKRMLERAGIPVDIRFQYE